MNLFFSQFVSDSIYALDEPNLDADCDYWHKPEGADIR
jgi:hypothetical protein